MADLAPTVVTLPQTVQILQQEQAAEAIALIAAPVYRDAATGNQLRKAQCTTAVKAAVIGIALLGSAGAGEYPVYTNGTILDFGSAILTMGVTYVLSATAGKICPEADLVSGNFITYIGYPISTSQLQLFVTVTGQTKP